MKITKRQLGRIIREAIIAEARYDQLPYDMGGPWVDKDAPVGKGARVYDDLDRELTDEEIEASMQGLEGWGDIEIGQSEFPITFGYTDKNGEEVNFVANNADESDEFFHMFWKEYGHDYPYSVD